MADAAPLLPAYLIIGTDRPKVRRAVARLRQRVIDEAGSDINVVVVDAEHDPVEVLLDAAASPGLTLGTRLLLVLNGHKWKVKARQQIVAYLQDPMPETCLAIEGETFAASDALRKAVRKLGDARFDLPKKYEMAGWVRERAKAHRLPMSTPSPGTCWTAAAPTPATPSGWSARWRSSRSYCRGEAADRGRRGRRSARPDDDARDLRPDGRGGAPRPRAQLRAARGLYASGDPRNDANGVLYSLKRHIEKLDAAAQLPHADLHGREAAQGASVHRQEAAGAARALRPAPARPRLPRARRGRGRAAGEGAGDARIGGGVNDGDRLVVELALARLLA